MTSKALHGERCCGRRQEGGIYAELGVTSSQFGLPLDSFIICPPIKLTRDMQTALGVKALGVSLVERFDPTLKRNVTHILDWIGARNYPNVADWLEEARHMGVSRRLPSTLDYSRLTPDSRLLVIHPRGWIDDAPTYFAARKPGGLYWLCRKNIPEHDDSKHPSYPPPMCSGLWYEDIDGGVPQTPDERRGSDPREVIRDLPSVKYVAHRYPGMGQPEATPAIFASLPISRLVVIMAEDGSHEKIADAPRRSKLPVEYERE